MSLSAAACMTPATTVLWYALYSRLTVIARQYPDAAFATSLGAEDMVLTHAIFLADISITVFTLATAPGHEQYTRNMVTGASTAEVAVILIDATRVHEGVLLPQTRRHSKIAKLLGIRHIVVAVNKMDLVAWDQALFEEISQAYRRLADHLGIQAFHILPLSALNGDNVVTASAQATRYAGPPLLSLLESLDVADQRAAGPLRFPVQWYCATGVIKRAIFEATAAVWFAARCGSATQ